MENRETERIVSALKSELLPEVTMEEAEEVMRDIFKLKINVFICASHMPLLAVELLLMHKNPFLFLPLFVFSLVVMYHSIGESIDIIYR